MIHHWQLTLMNLFQIPSACLAIYVCILMRIELKEMFLQKIRTKCPLISMGQLNFSPSDLFCLCQFQWTTYETISVSIFVFFCYYRQAILFCLSRTFFQLVTKFFSTIFTQKNINETQVSANFSWIIFIATETAKVSVSLGFFDKRF